MRVTIIGAGAGGASAVAELAQTGHDVALWNRSSDTLAPFQWTGGIEYEGVLGEGLVRPRVMTTDLRAALEGAEALVCTLPTFLHASVATALVEARIGDDVPIVLNPGHTGGALEFRAIFEAARRSAPPVAEFSTLTYVARKLEPHRVTITGKAKEVRTAALPGDEAALKAASELFPSARAVRDVLASGLANANMVLHPPGVILGAAWIEATRGDFTFYVQGMTPGVERTMKALDEERMAVARAYGHELPTVIGEMQRIGTVEMEADPREYAAAIAAGAANRRIKAPGSLDHRYYREDFGHGLLPLLELAAIAGVHIPVAHALFRLAETVTGCRYREGGRTATAMGIAGLDLAALIARVRACASTGRNS
jgi:opine dehydrogenase